MKENIQLDLTREELQLLAGILMLNYMNGFRTIHESKRKIGMDLAQKVSLLDIKQWK